MPVPASDEELWTRQAVLHAEAEQILSELELVGLFDDVGPPLPAGSYVSGLMCWRSACSASRITGSSPARDTRFGSSNVAVTTPGVW